MSQKQLELVIDTPFRLWLQHYWWLVAVVSFAVAFTVGVLFVPVPDVWS
jgi:hypothetical protein